MFKHQHPHTPIIKDLRRIFLPLLIEVTEGIILNLSAKIQVSSKARLQIDDQMHLVKCLATNSACVVLTIDR